MSVYTHACKFATSVAFVKYVPGLVAMLRFKGLNTLVLIVPATNDVLMQL